MMRDGVLEEAIPLAALPVAPAFDAGVDAAAGDSDHAGLSSRREYAFLLACVRRALHRSGANKPLAPAEPGMLWARFLRLAESHQVLPLVHAALLEGAVGVPDAVGAWLEERCRTVVALNLSLAAELLELLAVLQVQGIEATPFKGPALATAWYGSIARRQISDLDLFVSREQFGAAVGVMRSCGYVLEERATGHSAESLRRRYKDVLFTHPESGVHVDLHWSAAEPGFDGKLSEMAIGPAGARATLLGREIPMQAPEELLFLLCVHGLRHRWETLKWICDLAAFFETDAPFDWTAALERARSVSRERTLLLGVMLAQELTGFATPDEIAQRIANDLTLKVLCRQIYLGHCSEGEAAPARTAEAVLQNAAFDALRLRSRESAPDRLVLFCGLIAARLRPTDDDRQWIELPARAAALYWVVRPVRILRHYGAACSLRMVRDLMSALCKPETVAG